MIVSKEYCPRCQAPRKMTVSTSQREETDSEGNSRKILTRNYHCETCQSFVRSEDIEDIGEGGDSSVTEVT
jgi:hypothetical protein